MDVPSAPSRLRRLSFHFLPPCAGAMRGLGARCTDAAGAFDGPPGDRPGWIRPLLLAAAVGLGVAWRVELVLDIGSFPFSGWWWLLTYRKIPIFR
jgi:hypothetical protein